MNKLPTEPGLWQREETDEFEHVIINVVKTKYLEAQVLTRNYANADKWVPVTELIGDWHKLVPATMLPLRTAGITDYWLSHYVHKDFCSLCGCSGVIDTRNTAISAAGVNTGKLNWCICPNGQAFRKAMKNAEPTTMQW